MKKFEKKLYEAAKKVGEKIEKSSKIAGKKLISGRSVYHSSPKSRASIVVKKGERKWL